MAKKRGKYHKTTRFSFTDMDMTHYRTTEAYASAVQTLFDRAAADVATNAAKINPKGVFSFDDYPSAKKHLNKIVAQLVDNVQVTIERGSRKEWLFACKKNDAFLESIMDTSKVKKVTLKKMQDRNLDALSTFQGRKVSGMELAQRVWKYVGDWKEHIECALDVGLGEGKSAAQLARDVKQDLRDPNRLFRRVRGKDGELHLSKAAKAFHPGQGVYRSSVKNVQRLTRSEINMAYRESDFLRWQQLDFVVGFRIERSNHEPLCKCELCERLKGEYPKTFKFVGWHPQCMCKAIPILMDDETFNANELGELRAALRNDVYQSQQAKNVVVDVPDEMRKWMAENAEKQANWKNTPYFVRDNFKGGMISGGLSIKLPSVNDVGKVTYRKPYEQLSVAKQNKWNEFTMEFSPLDWDFQRACQDYGVDVDSFVKKVEQAVANNEYWRETELRNEYARLERSLKSQIAYSREQAEQIIDAFEQAAQNSEIWFGDTASDLVKFAWNNFRNEDSEKYPNYVSILRSGQPGGALDVKQFDAKIQAAKTAYNDAVAQAKQAIAMYGNIVDVSKIKAYVDITLSKLHPATDVTKDLLSAIKEARREYDKKTSGVLAETLKDIKDNTEKIDYREVKDLPKALETQEIIDRLGGGDNTDGSCSSLAFAWAANRGGMDVLDFRDGSSRKFFSNGYNIRTIVKSVGGMVEYGVSNRGVSGIEMMRKTEIGKEYYLAIGRHAAIVRQVSKGKYQYLELQTRYDNGWHDLNAEKFAWRFSARGRQWSAEMVEVSKLHSEPSFRKVVGYINTAADKQNKGASGTIK